MFNPLGGSGDLQKLQQQAKKMQEALQQEELTVEKNGVMVVIRGNQQLIEVSVDGVVVEKRIAETINEAIRQTQELAAKKLIEVST